MAEKGKQAEINIGLVGHVDAGKTSLVEAITGVWADTHSEELKRGISIRLGYADAVLENKGKKRIVSFVDAPGHETLMMTMLSGAAIMNGAILVIAANEKCPQPQTVEHMNALHASRIKNIIVAQNKIDLVTKEKAIENYKQIKEFLKEYGYEKSPIIPTAAHSKANIKLLIETINETIKTPKFENKKEMKMYCARSFDINKPGTKPEKLKGGVLGGSIIQGSIKVGDQIEISPWLNSEPIITTVRSISCSSGELKEGKPGGLLAIGTDIDPSTAQNDQLKGQVIGTPKTIAKPTDHVELELIFIERVLSDLPKKFTVNEMIVLITGTMPVIGTITETIKNSIKVKINRKVPIEKGQNIAINKKSNAGWRLIAYGKAK